MTFTFNLVDEPFIPCIEADDALVEMGLKDCLRRAPELREIRDSSPLATIALHRLLLAILHHNFGPATLQDWKIMWQAGRWDQEALANYWQRRHGRFELFDGKHLFYQTAESPVRRASSINRLAHELASGNNATLFDHTLDDDPPPVSPAETARLLITQQAFAVGGGKSDTGYTSHAPLIQGAVVFPQGKTLFETLMLNLVAYNSQEPMPADHDAPAWQADSSPPISGNPVPAGYLDYLTWQSRTLTLHPESLDGRTVVRRVSYAQGRKLDAPGLTDPMMAYRRDDQGGWRALRLSEHKELWRDSGALFQLANVEQLRRPACFNWLARLVREGVLSAGQRFDFAVFGLASDRAKVNFWRHDRMPLPLAYLNDEALVASLQQALDQAEQMGRAVWGSVWLLASLVLAPSGQQADTNRVRALAGSLAPDRLYWSRLEAPFRQFMVRLAEDPAGQEKTVARWVTQELFRQAWNAFEQTARGLDSTARVLRAVARARQRLAADLGNIFRPFKEASHEQDS